MTGARTPAVRSEIRAVRRSAARIWNGSRGHDGGGVGAALGRVGQLLELDRGLALVVDRVPDARGARRPRRTACPALEVSGALTPLAAMAVTAAQRSALRRRTSRASGAAGAEVGGGHPPRLADRGRAAGHRHRGQVTAPLEAGQAGDQELTAPDRAVGPVAGAVEGNAYYRPDDRAVRPPLSARQEAMCAWWCCTPCRSAVQVERVLGGQVLRVQVVRHDLRVDVEQPAEVLDALGEGAQRLGVLQVADVVRDERVPVLGQAERVLQLGAAGQDRARERRRRRRTGSGT